MILRAAKDYLARGLSILPLRPSEKRPVGRWRQWIHGQMTIDTADAWWNGRIQPTPGIGIITGPVSGDLCVIDIEPEHVAFVVEHLGLTHVADTAGSDTTKLVRTARGGLHLYCRENTRSGKLQVGDRVVGDIRGKGGYVVAPPTTTPDGAYGWVGGATVPRWTLDDLGPIPAWAERAPRATRRHAERVRRYCGVRSGRVPVDVLERRLSTPVRIALHAPRDELYESPSERDFRIVKECIAVGADPESIEDLIQARPAGDNFAKHAGDYLERTHDAALIDLADAWADSVWVQCIRVIVSNGRIHGGAKQRASFDLRVAGADELYRYTVPTRLGPPFDDALAGEWWQVARAFGTEPTPDVDPPSAWARAFIRAGRVRRLFIRGLFVD